MKTFYISGKLQLVLVSSIVIDNGPDGYQREQSNKRSGDLGKGYFNKNCILPPLVNVRDVDSPNPQYFAMDGGHRKYWAELNGYDQIECLVYYNLTRQQEAEIFLSMAKGIRGISSRQAMKAALVAEKPYALTIERALKRHNLTWWLDRDKEGILDIDFEKPAILEELQRKGDIHLDRVLKCMAKGWRVGPRNPRLQPAATDVDLIRAFSSFLMKHSGEKGLTDSRIISTFKANPASKVVRIAQDRLGLSVQSGNSEGRLKGGNRAIQGNITKVLEEIFGVGNPNVSSSRNGNGKANRSRTVNFRGKATMSY